MHERMIYYCVTDVRYILTLFDFFLHNPQWFFQLSLTYSNVQSGLVRLHQSSLSSQKIVFDSVKLCQLYQFLFDYKTWFKAVYLQLTFQWQFYIPVVDFVAVLEKGEVISIVVGAAIDDDS